jgi:hypothetical protein
LAIGVCSSGCVALVDTGSSFIGIPKIYFVSFVQKVISGRSDCAITVSREVICGSSSLDGLPEISFVLNGKKLTLSAKDYMITNHLGFMPVDIDESTPFFILGDTFIKTFYTVFDQDARRIGFASPKDTPLVILRYVALGVGILLALLSLIVILRSTNWCSNCCRGRIGSSRRQDGYRLLANSPNRV